MDDSRPPATVKAVEDQVRELGFDPMQLTPREREELVDIYRQWPNELLTVTVR